MMQQPTMTMDFLNPQRTTPQAPQNLLRVTNKGCGGPCGCAGCGGQMTNALAGIGRASLRGTTLGQGDIYATPAWLQQTLGVLSLASGVAGAYHGYKRHDSVWGAIGWSLLGFWFWPISMPVAFAQGFGKRK
jgi:hypothetical protein